jgi:hypothetical protein
MYNWLEQFLFDFELLFIFLFPLTRQKTNSNIITKQERNTWLDIQGNAPPPS